MHKLKNITNLQLMPIEDEKNKMYKIRRVINL